MKGKNLIQLLKAIDYISRPEGATRRAIAELLNTGLKTVSRLIDTMYELGLPVFDEKEPLEKEKRWKLEENYILKLPNIYVPDLSLSYSELISLYLLKSESNILQGTEIDDHITTAFSKLNLFVPKETREHLKKIKQIFISKEESAKHYSGKEGLVNIIVESIINQTCCKITYHSTEADRLNDYEVCPLHIFQNEGELFFFAGDQKENRIKTYAIDRIRKILTSNVLFEYPDDFSPYEKLNTAFNLTPGDSITVKIWFSDRIALDIKNRSWANDQMIKKNQDGSITLEMKTAGWRDVKRRVMSYGIDAKLIEPFEMKEEIENEILEMAGRFKIKKGDGDVQI